MTRPPCPRASICFAVIIIVLAMGGCLGTTPADHPIATDPDSVPVGYEIGCPPGTTLERRPGVCVRTIQSTTESYEEPFLAIHPSNPNVMAIGVNAGQTSGTMQPETQAGPLRLDILVTSDGGVSWTARRHPSLGDVPGTLTADPALVIDDDGVLHLTGLYILPNQTTAPGSPGPPNVGYNIFYTSSPNLGATWSTPRHLAADGDNGRSWIAAADNGIQVIWADLERTFVASSRDAGFSWNTISLNCTGPTAPALVEAQSRFVCRDSEGNVWMHNASTRAETEGRRIIEAGSLDLYPTRLVETGGWLWMVGFTDEFVLVRSDDGGHSWSAPVSLRDQIRLDDEWDFMAPRWVEADPWGGIHVLIEQQRSCGEVPQVVCVQADTAVSSEVAHVVFDAANGTTLKETLLTAPAGTHREPPVGAPSFFDEFHTMAFTHESGFVVWSWQKGLDYSLVHPMR